MHFSKSKTKALTAIIGLIIAITLQILKIYYV